MPSFSHNGIRCSIPARESNMWTSSCLNVPAKSSLLLRRFGALTMI